MYRTSGVKTSRTENDITSPVHVLPCNFLFTGRAGCVHVRARESPLPPSLSELLGPSPTPSSHCGNKQQIAVNKTPLNASNTIAG